MIHTRFIYRQITSSLKQTFVFVACVALSLVTLVSLGGFGESVNNALLRDARQLIAADIVVRSEFPFQDSLNAELDRLQNTPGVQIARTYEFITLVRTKGGDQSLLSELKVVEPGYPFYGQVTLSSGLPFDQVLQKGQAIVGQNLLDRMGLKVGDPLQIGDITVTIADVVLSEPDQPVDLFSLGPRIFLSATDLDATGLIKLGSRVNYRALVRVTDNSKVDAVAAQLKAVVDPQLVQVNTYRTNQSLVQRFFENFLDFLSLIGIFTLMLAGIGTQSSLSAFIREREDTIAMLRTLGASGRFIIYQFFGVAAVLGAAGTLIGLVIGLALEWIFPILFAPFLPPQVEFVLSFRSILEALLLGFFVVAVFTFLPIYQLQSLKPHFIFRKEENAAPRGAIFFFAQALILFFLGFMTYRYLHNPLRTAYFTAGMVVLILVITFLAWLVLSLLRRQNIAPLDIRQAVRGLFRPRNATIAIIVTLAASLTVLFTIFLIERNLDASFVQAYPVGTPNVVLLDIQPDQRDGISKILGEEPDFIPVIETRIRQINVVAIVPQSGGSPGSNRDPNDPPRLDAPFPVTYRNQLLPSEQLIAGKNLFSSQSAGVAQVSISETMLKVYPFKIGDRIQFDIQGVPMEAQVTSIRQVGDNQSGFQPAFNFVFREQDLIDAPQTIVSTISIPSAELPGLQNKIAAAYPNVTVIDVTATIKIVAGLVADITTIIRFFTIFSIAAGILIIISSILATRFARIQESVYFKVLGAKGWFVLRVFALENVFIGFVSAMLALFLSQAVSWILVTRVFHLTYGAYWGSSLLLMVSTIILVMVVGLLASVSILQKKPITFLREQTVE